VRKGEFGFEMKDLQDLKDFDDGRWKTYRRRINYGGTHFATLLDFCITQLWASGPFRTCTESNKQEKKKHLPIHASQD